MPQTIKNQNVYSLLEVSESIQNMFSSQYTGAYWIKAEMIKLNHYRQSGHAYPDLVEKRDGKVVAQMRGTLWSSRYDEVNSQFLSVTKEPLKDGINILFRAQIKFDPVYGLSLNILSIDPSFTLGDLEKEKQACIKKLKEENVFETNKRLALPLLPQRIAIISVESSKGYADFLSVIDTNSWGYKFFHMLFPSLLQGDQAVDSILKQLNRIEQVKHHFDIVAIIRGGGGDVGLSCYNDYSLSKKIATFPLPVFSGIGHATNETVVEMISHVNAITPTKLAEFLIQKFHNFSVPVQDNERKLNELSIRMLADESAKLNETSRHFQAMTQTLGLQNKSTLENLNFRLLRQSEKILNKHRDLLLSMRNAVSTETKSRMIAETSRFQELLSSMDKSCRAHTQLARLSLSEIRNSLKLSPKNILKENQHKTNNETRVLINAAHQRMDHMKSQMEEKSRQLELLDPLNVLERGYSITYLNSKALHHSTDVEQGDIIETKLFNGKMESVVRKTNLTEWKKKNRTQKPSKSFRKS